MFRPLCRPSSGCPRNLLSDYTVCVVILEGDEISSYIIDRGISILHDELRTSVNVGNFY